LNIPSFFFHRPLNAERETTLYAITLQEENNPLSQRGSWQIKYWLRSGKKGHISKKKNYIK
jgi:hypothetical protein